MMGAGMPDYYDEYYYLTACGRPYERTAEWLEGNARLAERIVATLHPATALDAGCAMGFLVEALRAQGVEAFGVDISAYAIEHVLPEIRPFCWVGSILKRFPRRYDLIVCNETLEHLQPAEAPRAISNLCRHSDDVLFCSTPFDFRETTHFNVRPPEYWAELFAENGFLHDVEYDATFLAPWAMRFRKGDVPLRRLVATYERHVWRLAQETTGQRELALEQRKQMGDLQERVRQAESERDANERRAAELAARKDELQALTAELEAARAQAAQAMRDGAEHAERARAAEKDNLQSRALLAQRDRETVAAAQSERQISALRVKLTEHEGTLLETETERRRLEKRAADLEQHLLRVYNSLSMRLTAPLRRALMLLRGQPPADDPSRPPSRLRMAWVGAASLTRRGWRVLREEGVTALWRKGWRLVGSARVRGASTGPPGELPPAEPMAFAGDDWKRLRPSLMPTPRSLRVLFFNGQGNRDGDWSQSPRYRVHNVRAALAQAGLSTSMVTTSDLPLDLHLLAEHDLLVLFRAGWTPELDLLVQAARHYHVPVIYDVDDYVFEPRLATPEYISGITGWPEADRQRYLEGVVSFRRALELCDYFTGSTEYLVERAAELGKSGAVVCNGPGEELIRISHQVFEKRTREPKARAVRLLYMSGTATHQRDFGVAAPAVAAVMRARPQVRLHVIGPLDLTEYADLAPFRDRIERTEFVEWRMLPAHIVQDDINLAPLEIGNPFCEAKSELKYSEAALVGLPTVASATRTYAHAIRHGDTGFVCNSTDDWSERLLALVDDAELRHRLGGAARAHVLEAFGPATIAAQAREAYRGIVLDYRTAHGRSPTTLEIGWVLTPPIPGSGGHNAIFQAANEMARQGHHVVLYFPKATGRGGTLREDIRRHFNLEPAFEVACGMPTPFSHDALIATHYTTAHFVAQHAERARLCAYFVQDFEPYFYPVGADYFDAERTYRFPFYCVTVGDWLADRLHREYGREADSITFWVDRELYFPRRGAEPGGPLRVAFLARPDMPRRCFSLGVEALAQFKRAHPAAQLLFFGTREIPRHDIGYGFTNLGVLPKRDLADLYRSAHIGLAFSTTNPSLVPIEMMACGLPVVDIDVLGRRDREAESPAVLAEPSAEAVAEALGQLAASREQREQLRLAGLAYTDKLPTPREAFAHVGRLIAAKVAGL